MKSNRWSRRSVLKGAGAALGASMLEGPWASIARAQSVGEKPALLIVFLEGGYNAVFGSADSFAGAGTFGVSGSNQMALGGGLVVDRPTFGTLLPTFALEHMASVGVLHNTTDHNTGKMRMVLGAAGQSLPLTLANALGGTSAFKAAAIAGQRPQGTHPAVSGVAFEDIRDMASTIAALGGTADATIPDRAIAARGMEAALSMSNETLARSPQLLTTTRDGFRASIDNLQKPVQPFSFATLAQAYGASPTQTAVRDFRQKIVAAELMMTAGSNVVYVEDGGWDSHNDRDASNVRNMMSTRILPPLATFMNRMLNQPDRNVMVAIIGDFARSLPGSDHANCLSATVFGKYIRNGTTGRVDSQVRLPAGTPGSMGLWALLAQGLKAPGQPFGANPHGSLLLT